ncbi:MAG TPA: hypothetical protein VGL88_07750 [Pseudonocardiaceae bacterium]
MAAAVSLAGLCDLTAATADHLDNGAVTQFVGGHPANARPATRRRISLAGYPPECPS